MNGTERSAAFTRGTGREPQSGAENDRPREYDDTGAQAVTRCAPGKSCEPHDEEVQRHGARDGRAAPAGGGRNRPQKDGKREHRSDGDATHQPAKSDNYPTIGERHTSVLVSFYGPSLTTYEDGSNRQLPGSLWMSSSGSR